MFPETNYFEAMIYGFIPSCLLKEIAMSSSLLSMLNVFKFSIGFEFYYICIFFAIFLEFGEEGPRESIVFETVFCLSEFFYRSSF
jgi:hypothetical protein